LRVRTTADYSLHDVIVTPHRQALSRPSRPYEFPNGYNDLFGIERFRASEVLFEPSLWDGVEGVLPQTSAAAVSSIQQLVAKAIGAVDVDSRPTLLSNIVCVGGGAFLPGMIDRLSYELSNQAPGQRIKIHSPGNSVERRHASWLGGSILASLGSFHQMWISKEEYEEHGAAIVHARAR
jgi:actin-related protein